jgi:hypothetical protein
MKKAIEFNRFVISVDLYKITKGKTSIILFLQTHWFHLPLNFSKLISGRNCPKSLQMFHGGGGKK